VRDEKHPAHVEFVGRLCFGRFGKDDPLAGQIESQAVAAKDLGAEEPLDLVAGQEAALLLRQCDEWGRDLEIADGQRFDPAR
jgi:hypothetical protein